MMFCSMIKKSGSVSLFSFIQFLFPQQMFDPYKTSQNILRKVLKNEEFFERPFESLQLSFSRNCVVLNILTSSKSYLRRLCVEKHPSTYTNPVYWNSF